MSDHREREVSGTAPQKTEVEKNLAYLFDEISESVELIDALYKDLSKVLSNEPVLDTEAKASEPPILATCHISDVVVDKVYVIRAANARLKMIRKDLRI
jgi:hypothetical protein